MLDLPCNSSSVLLLLLLLLLLRLLRLLLLSLSCRLRPFPLLEPRAPKLELPLLRLPRCQRLGRVEVDEEAATLIQGCIWSEKQFQNDQTSLTAVPV